MSTKNKKNASRKRASIRRATRKKIAKRSPQKLSREVQAERNAGIFMPAHLQGTVS